jgi:hypothetical protein
MVIARGVGRKLAVVALLSTAVVACDDNPLAEGRDKAAYFRLNPSNVAVNAGGTVKVDAIVVNQYGAATNQSVTATPCDAKITAVADTGRSVYEYPERFVITGSTLGVSCLVVSAGGVTDTVRVRVVPASIRVTGLDTLGSGETQPATVVFRNVAGNPVTGMTAADLIVTSLTTAQAVIDGMAVTGRAPGVAQIVARLDPKYGVTRVDTARVVVRAGAFSGTVTQGTTGAATGSIATVQFTEGNIAFDTDTQVRLLRNGEEIRTHTVPGTPATARRFVLPFGLPAGTINYEVVNIGPNQVASVGSFNLPSGTPAADQQEPDEVRVSTPKSMAPGQVFYGSISGTDTRDWVRLTVTEAGSYRVSMGWNDGSDHDLYVHSDAGATLLSLEGAAAVNPETGLITLQPGTYYLRAEVWTHAPISNRASTYYMTVVKQ